MDVFVSVVGRPELGTTRTRIDGNFALLVPGGGALLLRFERQDYLPVDRTAEPAWRGALQLDQVVLTPRATASTHVDTSGAATAYQVARGTLETDRDGVRQATLLFPPGIEAQTQPVTGGVVPAPALTVRITELTVGPAGSNALPGALPGPSAFFYAANIAVDEARTGKVDLSQPIPLYTENYLNLPVGTALPAGAYDPQAGRFTPAANGIVVAVLSIDGGSAELDTNGDGNADSASALAAFGISAAERSVLAALYAAGQSLLRLSLSQLGTCDVSPGPGPMPSAATPPRTNIPTTPAPRHAADVSVPVTGTEFALHYNSDRVLGYGAMLAQIVDGDGNTTVIVRDGTGALTAIVAPFGQQTALHVNANGYVDSVRPDPSNPAYAMQYVDARGLLQSFTTPRGTTSRFGYDALGVLASTTDPLEVTRQLSQSMGASARTSTESGPSGTVTVAQQRSDDGREVRVETKTDGTTTVLRAHNQQQGTLVLPDGTTIDRTRTEDVRWGTSAPATSAVISVPSGLRREASTYQTAAFASHGDPATATVVREQSVVNGAVWDTTIDFTTNTHDGIARRSRKTCDDGRSWPRGSSGARRPQPRPAELRPARPAFVRGEHGWGVHSHDDIRLLERIRISGERRRWRWRKQPCA